MMIHWIFRLIALCWSAMRPKFERFSAPVRQSGSRALPGAGSNLSSAAVMTLVLTTSLLPAWAQVSPSLAEFASTTEPREAARFDFLEASKGSSDPVQGSQFLQAPAGGQATPGAPQSAPVTLTLKDALDLAQKNDPAFLSALSDANVAAEDVRQARASRYPTLSDRTEYLGTQGNGKLASGRFVTNDGVHVYREWAVLHQDFNAGLFTGIGIDRAGVAQAIARARAEVARRGLAPTVTKAYYTLLISQRKYSTAQQALDQAQRALTVSQDLERGGEVAHSDVVRSQLQLNTQQQALRESMLAMGTARLDLSVLLYRDFNQNFSVVDDFELAPALPPLTDVQTLAERENPALRVAMETLRGANLDITIARQAYLPTLSMDFVEGIEANAFALHSAVAAAKTDGPLPNLGYFVTLSLNIPVWDWGTRRSKIQQARLRQEDANVQLSAAQRVLVRNLQAFYGEAQTAREQMDFLRSAVDLASESLRLNTLRYQAGEATILELVDAQTALILARNGYDDGILRYRVALSNLQTLTGAF
jgi:outer membrane protein TolC